MGCIPSKDGSKNFSKMPESDIKMTTCAPGVRTDGFFVSGTGSILCNTPISQSKSYFEVAVRKMGDFAIGISSSEHDLQEKIGNGESSWSLWSDGSVRYNGAEKHKYDGLNLNVDSIIGVGFDQSDLPTISFYVDGKYLGCLVLNLRQGSVFPSVYVSDDAELELNFGYIDQFKHAVPEGFEMLMKERSIL